MACRGSGLSPRRVCHQQCSSTPMTCTPSNRCESLINTRRPSARTASLAAFHDTPRPAATRATVRCWHTQIEGPAADAPPLLRRVEVEMLDPHAVLARSHRDKADIDPCDLYDSGARRCERVEESPPYTVRVVAPQALEIGAHDHRTKLGHPGRVGEDARSKAPLRCHEKSLSASQPRGSALSIPLARPHLTKQTGPSHSAVGQALSGTPPGYVTVSGVGSSNGQDPRQAPQTPDVRPAERCRASAPVSRQSPTSSHGTHDCDLQRQDRRSHVPMSGMLATHSHRTRPGTLGVDLHAVEGGASARHGQATRR